MECPISSMGPCEVQAMRVMIGISNLTFPLSLRCGELRISSKSDCPKSWTFSMLDLVLAQSES